MSDNPYAPPTARIDQPAADAERMVRPWQVMMAIRLAVVHYVIGFSVSLANWESHYNSLWEVIIMGIPSMLLIGWLYYRIYLGRNWARITLLVLFTAGAVMMHGSGNLMERSTLEKAQSIAGVAFNVAGLYFLFISPGRHWFRRRAARGASSESPETAKSEPLA